MDNNEMTPLGVGAPSEANYNPTTKEENIMQEDHLSMRGKLKSKEPHPLNCHITGEHERYWKGYPPHNTFQRAVRLKAPETCWVEGCEEPAEFAPYPLKHYSYPLNDKYTSGVHRDCPFLCLRHRQEDENARKDGSGGYTSTSGWATKIIYRPVLQPKGGHRE